MLTVNVTNLVVIGVIILLSIVIVIHLVKVYKENPCGDCVNAKKCKAFSKDKILKAYKKECKKERIELALKK